MTPVTSIIGTAKLGQIRTYCRQVQGLPGDLAEVGVYRGGTSLAMSNELPKKTVHMFDTFTGIPVRGEFDVHNVGDFADTGLEDVRKAFEGRKAEFHVGAFPGTAKDVRDVFCLVHLDGDQYQVTKDGLEFFYPRLVPGGVMILDDYRWPNCPGVEKALREFLSDKPETILEVVKYQAAFVKT